MKTGLSGLHAEYLSRAGQIRVAAQPDTVPPVSAYEGWLTVHRMQPKTGHAARWTAGMIRRAVVMRHGGCTQAEIGTALGFRHTAISKMFAELPPELRP